MEPKCYLCCPKICPSPSNMRFLQAYCVNDWSQSSKHWLDLISVVSDLASSPSTRSSHYVKSWKRPMINKSTHNHFVDYKAAFDSRNKRSCFCCNVCAQYTCEDDKAMQNNVEQFLNLLIWRPSDKATPYHVTSSTSPCSVLWKAGVHRIGTIF